jgi:predicted phosphodiesterase
MRVAILSDLHANLEALNATLKDVGEQRVDEVWCLGDVVGYGGAPHAVLDLIEARTRIVVKGNHDHAVATGELEDFNPIAAAAVRLHAQMLTPPERARLYALPTTLTRQVGPVKVLLAHGSPDDPIHEYVRPEEAAEGQRRWKGVADVILLGHTHLPCVALPGSGWKADGFHEASSGARDAPLIINPGSVGQPRDSDPRASYAVLDLGSRVVELHRVPYDVESAAQSIRRAGLDHALALRLFRGR